MDVLWAILEERAPQKLDAFFRAFGAAEAACMCYQLATAPLAAVPAVSRVLVSCCDSSSWTRLVYLLACHLHLAATPTPAVRRMPHLPGTPRRSCACLPPIVLTHPNISLCMFRKVRSGPQAVQQAARAALEDSSLAGVPDSQNGDQPAATEPEPRPGTC